PQLTAWVALGLRAAGADPGGALDYLEAHESELVQPTELALVACAEAALGHDPQTLLARLPARPRAVNEAIWRVFALRQSGPPAPEGVVAYVRRAQARNGGFPWTHGVAPDSNITAWAVQALRATGVRGKPIARALGYLRGLQARDGGLPLASGRPPRAQSPPRPIPALP